MALLRSKKSFFIIFLLIMNSANAFSQEFSSKSRKAITFFKQGLSEFQIGNTGQALVFLKQSVEKDKKFVEPVLLMAEIYKQLDNSGEEIKMYEEAFEINPDFFLPAYLSYGNALISEGRYLDAKEAFAALVAKNSSVLDKQKAKNQISRCDFAMKLKQNPIQFKPQLLQGNINTKYNDMGPRITADGRTMYFTITIPHDPFKEMNRNNSHDDFFVSTHIDSIFWSQPKNIGAPINTALSEGAITISADGNTAFFSGCNRKDGFGRCDIYKSVQRNGKWTVPVNLGEPINSKYWESQPSISPDGRRLFFVSDRPGGKGSLDIWCSTLSEENKWQKPVNLGASINTEAQEFTPFIHFDNQTLYFSSEGWLGMGGKDVFMSKNQGADSLWSKASNLGYPLNDSKDNYGFIIDAQGENGYYSAFSKESKSIDLFAFQVDNKNKPNKIKYLAIRIFDEETKKTIDAKLDITDSLQVYRFYKKIKKTNLQTIIPIPQVRRLSISCLAIGYNMFSAALFPQKNNPDTVFYNIPMRKLDIGTHVILENIYFDLDSSMFSPSSENELKKLKDFLQDNPNVNIEIGGHTDDLGTQTYNKKLSEARAKSVYEYLTQQGVDKNRLSYKGYGYDNPIIKDTSDKARKLNRRTEFIIIKQ